MATAGALNGTGVVIAIETAGQVFLNIGGQVSHTETLTNNLIEITTKTAMSYRELLPNRGIQMADYQVEIIFVSELGYDTLRALAKNKGIANFRIIADGGITREVRLMVASFVDTSTDNEALKGSVNLLSSDIFTT